MRQRNVQVADVESAIMTATRCSWQPDHETWKALGLDGDGEELAVAFEFMGWVEVATVM